MTDEQKKMLTEWLLEECWHEIVEVYGNRFAPQRAISKCSKCGWTYARDRTFTTWQDVGDCKEKLVEKGLWDEFWDWAVWRHREGMNEEDEMIMYENKTPLLNVLIPWLFRPTDETGKSHFARLVSEFLEGHNAKV